MSGVFYKCSGMFGIKIVQSSSYKKARMDYVRIGLRRAGEIHNREAARVIARGVKTEKWSQV